MIDNNKPLAQSGVGERIWALYHTDREEFRREVAVYFQRGNPGFTPVKVNYERRIIWLRDDR
ncbi:hypothetical protein [Paenibacillus sp. L3-i20]|uniref:hypothetical protein n=1 Tax=Paenibacillus sp. L3-i20 TaxID=2905833 RepID=UPI001EDD4DAA|nr:hypothetical protein [Paenibacillus sp. L3-i20]GKU79813.1 hypothetical protein L3i20_v242100 [Paenibacillus sp. L3-i20]